MAVLQQRLDEEQVLEVAVAAFPHGSWYRLTIEEQDVWKARLHRMYPVLVDLVERDLADSVVGRLGEVLMEDLADAVDENHCVTLTNVRRAVDRLSGDDLLG